MSSQSRAPVNSQQFSSDNLVSTCMTKNDIQFLAKTQIVYQYEIINGIFMSGNIN